MIWSFPVLAPCCSARCWSRLGGGAGGGGGGAGGGTAAHCSRRRPASASSRASSSCSAPCCATASRSVPARAGCAGGTAHCATATLPQPNGSNTTSSTAKADASNAPPSMPDRNSSRLRPGGAGRRGGGRIAIMPGAGARRPMMVARSGALPARAWPQPTSTGWPPTAMIMFASGTWTASSSISPLNRSPSERAASRRAPNASMSPTRLFSRSSTAVRASGASAPNTAASPGSSVYQSVSPRRGSATGSARMAAWAGDSSRASRAASTLHVSTASCPAVPSGCRSCVRVRAIRLAIGGRA